MDTPPFIVKKTSATSLTKNSFTPCRRVGLGRPSSGSLKKSLPIGEISTPSNDSSSINNCSLEVIPQGKTKITTCDLPLNLPLKQNDGQNKETAKVRRCLEQDLKTNKFRSVKRTLDENECEIVIPNTKSLKTDGFVKDSNIKNNIKRLHSKLSSPECSKPVLEEYENENKTIPAKSLVEIYQFDSKKETMENKISQIVSSLLQKKSKLDQLKIQGTYAKKHNLDELRAHTAKWRVAGQEALVYCVRLARQAGYSVTVQQLMEQHSFPPDLMGYDAENDDFQ